MYVSISTKMARKSCLSTRCPRGTQPAVWQCSGGARIGRYSILDYVRVCSEWKDVQVHSLQRIHYLINPSTSNPFLATRPEFYEQCDVCVNTRFINSLIKFEHDLHAKMDSHRTKKAHYVQNQVSFYII